jgi:hypothetical protein
MGGYSRWNVLGDCSISDGILEAFGISTEVIIGLFAREAEQIWSDWNLLIRNIIKRQGLFRGRFAPAMACTVSQTLSFLRGMLSALHN